MEKKTFKYGMEIQPIEDQVYFMEFGNGCRIEAKNNALNIDKIALNFQTFDKSNKETCRIPFYIDVNKALILSNDILSGRLFKVATFLQEKNKEKGSNDLPVVFEITGGVPASRAKREDGKPLFRSLRISKGKKWIINASYGPGKTTENGGFVADGKFEASIRVGLSDDSMKAFALRTQMEVSAYRTAKMIISGLSPNFENLQKYIQENKISEQEHIVNLEDEKVETPAEAETKNSNKEDIDLNNIDLSDFF